MNRNVLALAVAGVLLPSAASAQEVSAVEGAGYPLGEGTVVHPTLGAELGFTDNVFYGDTTNSRYASGIMRLVAQAAIASKEIQPDTAQPDEFLDPNEEAPAEPARQKVQFRAGGRLAYQEYISPTDFVRAQRNLAADLSANVLLAPQGTVSFAVEERFIRDTRPTNFQSFDGANRDANTLALHLRYQPGGRQLSAGLRWENQLDFFEASDQQFANRMENYIHARSDWEFFPYSKVFADLSYGFINGLGSNDLGGMAYKRSANPIRGGIGVATAITEIFTVKAHVGWGYASYDGGASYNSPLLGAEIGYRYAPMGRVVFSYNWDHLDSINADFYTDHALKLRVDHQFGKIVGDIYGDVRFRTYEGVSMAIGGGTTRSDLIFAVGADASYVLKDWLAIVANYRTEVDQTSFRYDAPPTGEDDPSYVRTELTAGVRVAL